jgi:hypothetical protein
MSTSVTSRQGSSILQHLRATKKVLQDVTFDARYVWNGEMRCAGGLRFGLIRPRPLLIRLRSGERAILTRGLQLTRVVFQFDVLEREAFEILRLIQLWRNAVAPINRTPPEILTLVPDFWNKDYDNRNRDIIALTHVCRAWREAFISRPSLWTDLDCLVDEEKARVYLERSKPLLISLSLHTDHPLLKIVPHDIGRLKSLVIRTTPKHLKDITIHLSHPAPFLEKLSIRGGDYRQSRNPELTSAIFNGDLSSLRELRLESVHTELPWRNMVNLASITLAYMSWDEDSIEQLFNFFESVPYLRKVNLYSATSISDAQNERLVSLPCLERTEITGGGLVSRLLDHLLIPVGAHLIIEVDLSIEDYPPRYFDNLRNFPNFTDIHLRVDWDRTQMRFSGPNGQVTMIPRSFRDDKTSLVLESLSKFDTSKVERLKIDRGYSPSSDPPYQTLLRIEHLRTLTLHHCASPHIFVHALHPTMSSSGTVVCPELEELVIMLVGRTLDVRSVIEVAAARASRGAKLKSVRIIGQPTFARIDVLELKKHVLDVECGPEVDGADGDDVGERG